MVVGAAEVAAAVVARAKNLFDRAVGTTIFESGAAVFVGDGDALVEYEALALPQGIFWVDGLKVVEDATFEVVDVLVTLVPQVGGGFLTTDATGAKHRDSLIFMF